MDIQRIAERVATKVVDMKDVEPVESDPSRTRSTLAAARYPQDWPEDRVSDARELKDAVSEMVDWRRSRVLTDAVERAYSQVEGVNKALDADMRGLLKAAEIANKAVAKAKKMAEDVRMQERIAKNALEEAEKVAGKVKDGLDRVAGG